MSTTLDQDRLVPPTLSEEEKKMVLAAERMIMKSLDHSRSATITIESEDGSTPSVSVPPQILKMLGQTLGLMARRAPIVLVHEKQEFSTVEAANYLNVSRPFVIKEIEKGNLPHRMVGTHRRVPFEELAKYAARVPYLHSLHQRFGQGLLLATWLDMMLAELERSGAVQLEGEMLLDV